MCACCRVEVRWDPMLIETLADQILALRQGELGIGALPPNEC